MLLAYCAITFRIDFSTERGILPEMLVMISCSSRRGREGSRRVFISCATHSFTCREQGLVLPAPWHRAHPWCCPSCRARGLPGAGDALCPGTHLGTEVGLGQAVPVHHVGEVVQHVAENLVLLLAGDGEGLLGREPPCERLRLEKAERGRLAWVLANTGLSTKKLQLPQQNPA